jgi:hypothetical protein
VNCTVLYWTGLAVDAQTSKHAGAGKRNVLCAPFAIVPVIKCSSRDMVRVIRQGRDMQWVIKWNIHISGARGRRPFLAPPHLTSPHLISSHSLIKLPRANLHETPNAASLSPPLPY